MSAITPTFSGELQLAGWSETHNGGAKVTFWLQSAEDLEVFKGLTAKKGNTAGHRFMAALVEVGDDELPVPPEPETTVTTPRAPIGDCCYRAIQWCSDPTFWAWANSLTDARIFFNVNSKDDARAFVLELCGVESRKELDTNSEANKAWHRLIREPYRVWLLQNPQ